MYESNGLADLLQSYGRGLEPLLEGRIVGGNPTTIEQFPWQVSMQRFGGHRCGAVILSANRMLSAAHCTNIITLVGLAVRAGSSQSQSGGQLLNVDRVVNHPQFNQFTLDNDICVLWLAGSFNMAPAGLSTIRIPSQNEGTAIGAMGQVSGWGALCEGCAGSPDLRYVSKPVITNAQCNTAYSGGITAGMLCAGFPEGGRDACQGDSGGPFVVSGTLAGIVSWGSGCARPGFPGVYARVSFYTNWILAN